MKTSRIAMAITSAIDPLTAMLQEVNLAAKDIKSYVASRMATVSRPSCFGNIFTEFMSVVFGVSASSLVLGIAKAVTGLKGGAAIMAALKLIGFGCSAMLGLGILGVVAVCGYAAGKALFEALDEDYFRDNVMALVVDLEYTLAGTLTSFSFGQANLGKASPELSVVTIQLAAVNLLNSFKVNLTDVKTEEGIADIGCDIIKNIKYSSAVSAGVQKVFKECYALLKEIPWGDIDGKLTDEDLKRFGVVIPSARNDYRRKNFGKIRSDLATAYISANA